MKTWILLLSFSGSVSAWGAACCGSNSAVPALLSGPDRMQMATSFSVGRVVADADVLGNATVRPDSDRESAQNFLVSGALLLSDRWQTGLSVPMNRRARDRNGSTAEHFGLGDIAWNVGWEFLPEWSYSRWRPHGYLFSTLTFPTGGSTYESSELYSVDSHGRGFFRWALGALLTKSWGEVDVLLVGEVHRGLGRELSQGSNTFRLTPGWGYSALLGAGYSPGGGDLRLGISLGPQYDDGVRVDGPAPLTPPGERLWTTTLQATYFLNPQWTASLSYADQSWVGTATNSGLRRVATLQFQHHWLR